MYLILKKTLICWKTEFTIVYGKIEMQKKGSKNTQQGRCLLYTSDAADE